MTSQAQNYRPIALQNTMYKVYTAILADFIMDHCESNKIITEEQAAGKRGSWGCSDQLLINKMIYDQVTSKRRNLVTVWLDYKKAFDSVPHSWLIRSLELAKIPERIINAIKQLMFKWKTKVYLYGENKNLESDFINYLRGILQGDTLSLILFVLSVNPLSFLLNKYEGYKSTTVGKDKNITHLFFVDDVKLYAASMAKMIMMLELVTQFSSDIGMNFGVSKCAYQSVERGKRKPENNPIEVNGLEIQEIKDGDNYKYLGVDESVGIDGPLNKQRVIKEYKSRIKKIWNSELNGHNRSIAHNAFAIPLITRTIGILKWTKKEINDLDIATRKSICMSGGFHQASDIDRLYVERKKGGRGLRSIEDIYEIIIVGLMKHLEEVKDKHSLLKAVELHERQTIGRLGEEFIKQSEEHQNSSNVKQGTRKEHEQRWKAKVTHGYLQKKLEQDEFVNMNKTNKWLNQKLSSHVEGFVAAIQEQELDTKDTRKRREKKQERKQQMDIRCRVCGKHEESVYHLVCSCPVLAPTLYLEARHNQIARIMYQEILENEKLVYNPPPVTKVGEIEIWWDEPIRTHPKVEKNRPDLVIWDTGQKLCKIVEITIPLDTNIATAYREKEKKYTQLISAMQQQYRGYKFLVIVIAAGGLGCIPKNLELNLKKLGLKEGRINPTIERIQKAAILGTVKICKTVLNM